MFSVLLRVTFAWGFSVKVPKEAKSQAAFSLPPPTTIIGAVTRGLAVEEHRGEIVEKDGKLISAAAEFLEIFKSASAFVDVRAIQSKEAALGKYSEDPIRYQIHQFQKPDRRKSPDHRYNIIQAGKIYSPSMSLVLGLIGDEKNAEKKLGFDWRRKIEKACYGVTYVGAKESIVSVEDVVVDASPRRLTGDFRTRFYHPRHVVKEVVKVEPSLWTLGGTYVERFWRWEYEWGEEPPLEEYLVPGNREPVLSNYVVLKTTPGIEVFEVGEDGLAVFRRSI
ncbi:MAG: type I-A CRISPR-associated protein Cas5a [Candidatus Caldarchaeum sp.]|nr:type I-A CRISPR-associated protein Cas5a [Candidatus Caldarchaeum sp.]